MAKILENCSFDLQNIDKLYIGNVQSSGDQVSYPINYDLLMLRNIATVGITDWNDTTPSVIIGGQEIVLYEVLGYDNNISLTEELVIDNRSQSYNKTLTFSIPYIDSLLLKQTKTLLLTNTSDRIKPPPTIAFLIDGNQNHIVVGYDNPLYLTNTDATIGEDHIITYTLTSMSGSRIRYYDLPDCSLAGILEEVACSPTPTPTPSITPTITPTTSCHATLMRMQTGTTYGDPYTACVTGVPDANVYLNPGQTVPLVDQDINIDPCASTELSGSDQNRWYFIEDPVGGDSWAIRLDDLGNLIEVEQCETITPTPTPTPSITPTMTPSITPTMTPSPTPSCGYPLFEMQTGTTYSDATSACNGSPDSIVYLDFGASAPAQFGYVYTDVCGGNEIDINNSTNWYYIEEEGGPTGWAIRFSGLVAGEIEEALQCGSFTPTPTPTVTTTPTPTPTPSASGPCNSPSFFMITGTSFTTTGTTCAELGNATDVVYLDAGQTQPVIGYEVFTDICRTEVFNVGNSTDWYYMEDEFGDGFSVQFNAGVQGEISDVVAC